MTFAVILSVCRALLTLLFFKDFSKVLGESSHWTYTGQLGQGHWAETFPNCAGTEQSPVDIQTSYTQHNPLLKPIILEGYNDTGKESFTLMNDGHTVVMSLPSTMTLRGLPYKYSAVQLHLHWGEEEQSFGSEHLLNGENFLAEMHVVHYNSEKYHNVSAALNKPDGVAVLSVLLETTDDVHAGYENIFRQLGNIKYSGQKVSIPSFDVQKLFPEQLDYFYRYNGSLTTPPCYQHVLWTVFHHPQKIGASQLGALQNMLFSTEVSRTPPIPLVNNFRELQPLNMRTIYSSFPHDSTSAYTAGETFAILIGILFGYLGLILPAYFIIKKIRTKRQKEREGITCKSDGKPEEELQQP
ncbi:carbonic anhydrase 14 [Protopterus annectens]|uniref:carbonic anhydrase 14 n=1 Tax=Protopterus annectens TaxID=7888 RepID=UPI001CFBAF79|nr:carbonic anhydrase 14 [Protopterus annectens]